MRLIDADLLIESIQATLNMESESFPACLFREVIDEQSVAFDVEKVISKLKRDKFIESERILSDIHQGYNAGLNRAIEIVKGGGTE